MKERLGQEIKYDIKSLGFNFWVPPLVTVIFIIITIPVTVMCRRNNWANVYTMPLRELYLPLMGALWGIFSLQDMLEEAGGEIYFSYHRKRIYWGIWRQLRFFVLYAALAAVACLAVGLLMGQNFFPAQYLLYVCQGFLLMGLGFLGMTLFGKAGDALIVLALYVCAHIMFGQSGWTGYTTVYLGNEELPAGSFAQAGILMIRAVVLGAACFIGGHIRMLYR